MVGNSDPSLPASRSLYAVVVSNHRIEGKTKQKVVKYLAHISEPEIDDQRERRRFWARALRGLDEIGLEGEVRSSIERKMEEIVPRPG